MLTRIWNLIRGFFGLATSKIESNNPEALLEVEKENLRKQTSDFNKALANHAALIEQLSERAKKTTQDEDNYTAKAKVLLQAGNRDMAAQAALRSKNAQTEHTNISAQLDDAEKQYKTLLTTRDVSVKAARDKIEEISRGINDMKIKKAAAELTEMANGMIGNIGAGGDNLNRISEMVEAERTKAAGRARVANDSIDTTDIVLAQAEQDQLANSALADLEASLGLTSAEPVKKTSRKKNIV